MFVYLILLLCICNLNECRKPNVLVIGGSGRVGGSALRSLLKQNIIGDVGGRDIRNWKAYLRRFPDLTNTVRFQQMDIFNEKDRNEILPRYDLIINTAGPFQGLSEPLLLESCLKHGVAYLDVCDDIALSRIARGEKFQKLASSTHTPAVISAGIWPGISSLLAQQLLRDIQQQSSSSEQRAMSLEQRSVKPKNCRFNFFTAGSGGAGQTILTATFLLLGEPVLSYQNGSAVYFKTASDPISRDFGPGIGEREIVRLNLIECESCHSAYSAECKIPPCTSTSIASHLPYPRPREPSSIHRNAIRHGASNLEHTFLAHGKNDPRTVFARQSYDAGIRAS